MTLSLQTLAPIFKGFIEKLKVKEVQVPPEKISDELAALITRLQTGGQVLRRVTTESGFVGYYLAGKDEPMMLSALKK